MFLGLHMLIKSLIESWLINVEVSCSPNEWQACTAIYENLRTTRHQLHRVVMFYFLNNRFPKIK